ncbi:MAG TPA: CPBP family intramembrane glutamic endopeptidase [Steroidobacteraceae bacterium]|nr:CPBP family intramembrane glutamic endopeptidase [Steroidobacteraceae bacterium]
MISPPRWLDVALLAIVSALILSFVWDWQPAFGAAQVVFTIALIGALLCAHAVSGASLRDAGFRLDTFSGAATLLVPFTGLVIASVTIVGHSLRSTRFPGPADAVVSLVQAVAFGLAQQYVLLGFFYRALERLFGSNVYTIVATAALFSLFHLPNPFLSIATFIAGVVAALVYRRAPNLWVNAVAHGLISYHLYYALPFKVTGALRVGPGYWTP